MIDPDFLQISLSIFISRSACLTIHKILLTYLTGGNDYYFNENHLHFNKFFVMLRLEVYKYKRMLINVKSLSALRLKLYKKYLMLLKACSFGAFLTFWVNKVKYYESRKIII